MSNASPRIRGLADDLHELAADIAAEFGRDGLTATEACLIERLGHHGRRLDWEVSIEDYRDSLRSADPFGRRMQRTAKDLEGTYGVGLPPLPDAVWALGDGNGETD